MLKIVPVLDILDHIAVHAIRGLRKEYKPLESKLCASTRPMDVAIAFESLGFTELYVADLDAISGRNQHLLAVKQIVKASRIRLVVDAGVTDLERAKDVLRSGASKIVVGTETLSRTRFVREAIRSLGQERVMVSLDLKNDKLLSNFNGGKTIEPMELLRSFCDMGLAQVIVLDLSRVGSGEGVNIGFLKQLLGHFDLDVFVGGGVKNLGDLLELKMLGVRGVLLATALHSGAISVEDIVDEGMEM